MEKMEGVRHTLLLALGFIVLISTLVLPSVVAQKVVSLGHRHEVKGYRIGQNVTFQCQKMGEWVPGPYVPDPFLPIKRFSTKSIAGPALKLASR
jgi:hypothetical protein